MAHGSASNFIRQTVGSSVGTNDPETIDVSDASAFPDPSTSQYDIVIWDAGSFNRPDQDSNVEVMTVTARDTGADTLDCDRGQQGTSNTSHPSSSDVIVAPLSQLDVNTVDAQTVTTDELNTASGKWTFTRGLLGPFPLARSSGSGSVTPNAPFGPIQLREPGAAASTEESRIYQTVLAFDPAEEGSITFHVSNITIDNNNGARIYVNLTDTPDGEGAAGSDRLGGRIRGDGQIATQVSNDGSASASTDSSQNNAYVNGLQTIKISWDGSTVTVETDDGSTTVTVSQTTNYPSGENLFLKVGATDQDGSNARNVDVDIDKIDIGTT